MDTYNGVQVKVTSCEQLPNFEPQNQDEFDFDKIIFDLDNQIDLLSSKADKYDYLVSASSGLLCGLIDILWVGEFSLERGRNQASNQVDSFVKKTAKLLGCPNDDLESSVRFLEKKFPIASDGNTPDFGGGLQHHLRDFAHHPTLVGLMFSLLTQFTYKAYGTDTNGVFKVVNVSEASKALIGKDVPSKILNGTLVWFFHLVSDMAGSSSSVGKSGGTGLPGPLLSLAKELSALPFFKNLKVKNMPISEFLSKLFNGTLLAEHDESGKIIKDSVINFDLRAELGVGLEIGRQALPVIANECIMRSFYFIRRFAMELRSNKVCSFSDLKKIDWKQVKPTNNPTLSRMLLIATGVFTIADVSEAVITKRQKCWVSINYVGVGRFAIAIGQDVGWYLKSRKIKQVKEIYKNMQRNTYTRSDNNLFEKLGKEMDINKLGLTLEQTEILYNLQYFKALNSTKDTDKESIKLLKKAWANDFKEYITKGFSSFVKIKGAEMHWFEDEHELRHNIIENDPKKPWFRLVLLEAMSFQLYYGLGEESNKKYHELKQKYDVKKGDTYIDDTFSHTVYYIEGTIFRYRKTYKEMYLEFHRVLKYAMPAAVAAAIAAGAIAPFIPPALVGMGGVVSSLAYIGTGTVAASGLGVVGSSTAIVGGGAILGAGTRKIGELVNQMDKDLVVQQSVKLLVSVKEIFLNYGRDIEYTKQIEETYVQNIADLVKSSVDLKLKADVASGKEKRKLNNEIKKIEEATKVMKLTRKLLLDIILSYEEGEKKSKLNDLMSKMKKSHA